MVLSIATPARNVSSDHGCGRFREAKPSQTFERPRDLASIIGVSQFTLLFPGIRPAQTERITRTIEFALRGISRAALIKSEHFIVQI
jgi:hypothetical protein